MLAYYLNNVALQIDPGTSFILVNRNPACFFDTLQDRAALGVTIPFNEHNAPLLDNPERFERYRTSSSRKYTGFEIRYQGSLLISGTLVVKFNGEAYEGWVQSNLGALGEEQQERFINEMNWPTNKSFTKKASYDDNTDDYGIMMVHNRGFFDGVGKEKYYENFPYLDADSVIRYRPETRNVLSYKMFVDYAAIVNYDLDTIADGCVISPYLHLKYVIKESLRMNSFFINRNDMLINSPLTFTKNLKVYNNFNILDFVPTTTQKQVDEWEYNEEGMVTNDVDEIEDGNFGWQMGTFNYADLLPRRSYKEFLLGLQNMINYIFFFKKNNDVDIIDRNAIPNATATDVDKYFRGVWKIGEQKSLRLKFTAEFDKTDGNFGEDYEDLSDRWKDFKDPVATVADLDNIASPDFGELRLVEETNEIFEYGFMVVTAEDENHIEDQLDAIGWKFVSNGPQPYIYGDADNQEEIKTAFSTLRWRNLLLGLKMPIANQKGNMAKMRNLWNDFTFRLLPSSTLLYNDSLFWEGQSGLFNGRWANWAEFWANRVEVEAEFDYPLNMVTHIQDNICEPLRTREGKFIIEEMRTEFGMFQIGTTTIQGYKL